MSDTVVIIQFLMLVAVEGMVLLLAYGYWQLLKRHQALDREHEKALAMMEGEKEEIRKQARRDVVTLMEQAQEQATKMIEDAQVFGVSSNQALSAMLEQLSAKQVEVSNQVIGRVRDETILLLEKVVGDLKTHSQTEMSGFTSNMNQVFAEAKQKAEKEIEVAYGLASQEVEAYKQKRLEAITRQMSILVGEVVEKVLNKTIDDREHERLVLEALEEAKRDGIL